MGIFSSKMLIWCEYKQISHFYVGPFNIVEMMRVMGMELIF